MIVLVTGGREYKDTKRLFQVLDALHEKNKFTFLVHGDAIGADQMAHRWCKSRGVHPVAMEALWDAQGLKAGTLRNTAMLQFAKPELCVAFPGGRGTANMMRQCFDAGVTLIDEEDLVL